MAASQLPKLEKVLPHEEINVPEELPVPEMTDEHVEAKEIRDLLNHKRYDQEINQKINIAVKNNADRCRKLELIKALENAGIGLLLTAEVQEYQEKLEQQANARGAKDTQNLMAVISGCFLILAGVLFFLFQDFMSNFFVAVPVFCILATVIILSLVGILLATIWPAALGNFFEWKMYRLEDDPSIPLEILRKAKNVKKAIPAEKIFFFIEDFEEKTATSLPNSRFLFFTHKNYNKRRYYIDQWNQWNEYF